jgi:SnoaL-like domain
MDVIAVAERFCAGWTSLDAEAFSMLFAPEGYYTDIAFGITRRGRDHVREHHQIWRTAVPEFAMLKEHAYESGSNVIVKTVCYGTFSGGDLGGSKLKATFKSFRARAISVLELDEQSQILACTEYYDRSTMPIGDATPFDHLAWPHKDLGEALGTRMAAAG